MATTIEKTQLANDAAQVLTLPSQRTNITSVEFNSSGTVQLKQTQHSRTDVLIIGAGPAGLFMAHALARLGINIRIIDRRYEVCAETFILD
ncbi:MAG TPA: FAD-dependent monooxygenase [Chlamydiales bacterium]|nr:FAD-dependent monooxygenase [Chlamydiales bacterium]